MTRGLGAVVVGVAALLASAAAPLRGQESVPLDRVVAVVGRVPILLSEVDEQIFSRRQGQPVPPDSAPMLQKAMVQEMVDLELLYQVAIKDTTIKVTDQEVDGAVDEQMRNIRRRFQSDQQYRAELRESGFLTPEEYRRWLTDTQRKELIRNKLIDQLRNAGKMKSVIPTERELRAAYEQERGRQSRPETVSFQQIAVAPAASPGAKQRALALADSILLELRGGADFATAARRFSMDPGSKEQGGSLGWFRRGIMDTRFEDVAFNIRPGIVSDPVETAFGYHLIQVERSQPSEVLARHILIMPEITQAESDSAHALAERIAAALAAGASFDSLAGLHHDPLEEREARGMPADKLPPVYATALKDLPPGQVAAVIKLESPTDPLRSKFAAVRLTGREDAGDFKYEDLKDQLRQGLSQRLTIRRYLDQLRGASYVEVRDQ